MIQHYIRTGNIKPENRHPSLNLRSIAFRPFSFELSAFVHLSAQVIEKMREVKLKLYFY